MQSYMDETEIKIIHIEQLHIVHFYTLDDIDGKALGLAVFYGKNGSLNLCAFDEFFEMFVAKVLSVYSKLTPEERDLIYADDNTRNLLDGAVSLNSQALIQSYSQRIIESSNNNSILIGSGAYIDTFLTPAVKYTIEVLYNIFRINFKASPYGSNGWFGRGNFQYTINGQETFLPYKFIKSSPGRYKAVINNFITETNTLYILLNYENDRLIITFKDSSTHLDGLFTYDLLHKNDTLNIIESIRQNGKELVYVNYEIDSSRDANEFLDSKNAGLAALLPRQTMNAQCFRLPWNQTVISNISNPEDNSSYSEYQTSYYTDSQSVTTVLNFFENRTELNSEVTASVSSSKMLMQIYKEHNKKTIYASFDDAGYNSAGYYKQTLENKIFQFTDKE